MWRSEENFTIIFLERESEISAFNTRFVWYNKLFMLLTDPFTITTEKMVIMEIIKNTGAKKSSLLQVNSTERFVHHHWFALSLFWVLWLLLLLVLLWWLLLLV